MKSTVIGFSLIILCWGCSASEKKEVSSSTQKEGVPKRTQKADTAKASPTSDLNSSYEMNFIRGVTYGATDEVMVGEIANVAVDDQNRVFIADMDQTTIHAFSPGGDFLTSIGKQGRGPGEFGIMTPRTTMEIHSGRLYVTDGYYTVKVHVYSLEDFSFSHSMKLEAVNTDEFQALKNYDPKYIHPLTDGRFLVSYQHSDPEYRESKSFIRYVTQDSSRRIVSGPILEQKGRTYLTYENPNTNRVAKRLSFPFFGESLIAVSDDDHLYATKSEEFKVQVYNTDGELVNTIRHPFKNRVFNKTKVLERYKKTDFMVMLDDYEGQDVALKMIRQAENLPETWPALENMFFDDENRLWAATIVDDIGVYEWWVLKKSGEVITKFEWPRDKPIKVVQNGYMYTHETEKETCIENIVRYRIKME
ncbi:6-bladed beta-propeller [Aliifodinibius sp. S!AR15-10]|uniref:6-bladed beta-propeller n=1 Tax=Aliifodinibius sp. S!AR15-10 TaxID=2950437 RepID=UPI002863B12D|nr:6-bladed beta-propeller [Aliifodinibius sp. S!AR15-10]MDR8391279.1 6-bladed beta-propeller [Aliifodinibius sp. S!AR15-10]